MIAAPVIKWAGGKARLLPELMARMPTSYERYYEPFAGGAALFFRNAPARAVLSDSNPDLIALYTALRDDVAAVAAVLGRYQSSHCKEHYYATRAAWNALTPWGAPQRYGWTAAERAAAFVYLNRTCFNGLWRVNQDGHFNVPMGKYANPTICAPDVLRAASAVLSRAELRCGDFRTALDDIQAGDFVYLDPPYVPASVTANFVAYDRDGFNEDDQRALATTFKVFANLGVRVMLSNSDTPLVRELYQGFRIDQVQAPRSINSKAGSRGPVAEVIVIGGY